MAYRKKMASKPTAARKSMAPAGRPGARPVSPTMAAQAAGAKKKTGTKKKVSKKKVASRMR